MSFIQSILFFISFRFHLLLLPALISSDRTKQTFCSDLEPTYTISQDQSLWRKSTWVPWMCESPFILCVRKAQVQPRQCPRSETSVFNKDTCFGKLTVELDRLTKCKAKSTFSKPNLIFLLQRMEVSVTSECGENIPKKAHSNFSYPYLQTDRWNIFTFLFKKVTIHDKHITHTSVTAIKSLAAKFLQQRIRQHFWPHLQQITPSTEQFHMYLFIHLGMPFVVYMCLRDFHVYVGLEINVMLYTTPGQSLQLAGEILPNRVHIPKGLQQSLLKTAF